VLLMLIIFLGVTRVVIEGGVPTLIAPGIASAQMVSSVGSKGPYPFFIPALSRVY